MDAAAMTAGDVAAALQRRWNPEEYVHVREAPQTPDRSGRKLDVVVCSAWKSRGFEIDGVEIKVSMSDLKRELDNAAKADWWWRHVNRFWIACPEPLALRVKATGVDLPDGWGLLSCPQAGSPAVTVKAVKHDAEPIEWPTVVGMLRAAQDCGYMVLQRARAAGRDEAMEYARREAERVSGDTALRDKLERLRRAVDAFKEASGIDITDEYSGRQYGQDVALIQNAYRARPHGLASQIRRYARELDQHTNRLMELADAVGDLTNPDRGERT